MKVDGSNYVDEPEVRTPSAQGLSQDAAIRKVIEHYLSEKYFSDSRRQIDATESLFALGILDSLAFVQLISFIESEFKVTIDDADVVPENFQSLNAIAQLILRIG